MAKKRKTKTRGINWKILIISLAIVYLVSLIGGIFSYNGVRSKWYESVKPDITPPNLVFPIVWNILFFLIALSLYFNWIKANKKQKDNIFMYYGANFFLNILWCDLFFGMKNPLIALFDIIALLGSILIMIEISYKIDKKAAYLLVPYCLWVGFAAILNLLTII